MMFIRDKVYGQRHAIEHIFYNHLTGQYSVFGRYIQTNIHRHGRYRFIYSKTLIANLKELHK
jgi:hypothetical protein